MDQAVLVQLEESEMNPIWISTIVATVLRGHSWLTGIAIGTTAERIAQDLPCSVLAAKPEGWRHDVS